MIGIVTIYYFLFRFEWFEKVSFVLVTSFFIYYLIYILVPVAVRNSISLLSEWTM